MVTPTFRSADDIKRAYNVEHGVKIAYCGPQADSMQAFIDFADQSANRHEVRSYAGNDGIGASWFGTADWNEAMDRLRFGWREGMARVEKIRANLTAQMPRATKPVQHYRPSIAPIGGLMLNFHDIATGGPMPFIGRYTPGDLKRGRKIIKLCVNSCFSAGVPTKVAEARGATIMALVQQLQLAKYSVDITVVFPCGQSKWVSVWHVAPAGYPINNDQLAYALISASALRRMGHVIHAYHTGRGSYMPETLRRVAPKLADTYDIVVESDVAYTKDSPAIKAEWGTETGQITWIKAMLKAEGITLS